MSEHDPERNATLGGAPAPLKQVGLEISGIGNTRMLTPNIDEARRFLGNLGGHWTFQVYADSDQADVRPEIIHADTRNLDRVLDRLAYNPNALKEIMGHRQLKTTDRYIHARSTGEVVEVSEFLAPAAEGAVDKLGVRAGGKKKATAATVAS